MKPIMKFNKEFIKELNAYCKDHWEHFECYPMDFEYNNKVFKFDDFKYLIDYNYSKVVSIDEISPAIKLVTKEYSNE